MHMICFIDKQVCKEMCVYNMYDCVWYVACGVCMCACAHLCLYMRITVKTSASYLMIIKLITKKPHFLYIAVKL